MYSLFWILKNKNLKKVKTVFTLDLIHTVNFSFHNAHVLCFGGNILALFCTRALYALYERQKVKGLLSEQTNLKLNLVTSFIPI